MRLNFDQPACLHRPDLTPGEEGASTSVAGVEFCGIAPIVETRSNLVRFFQCKWSQEQSEPEPMATNQRETNGPNGGPPVVRGEQDRTLVGIGSSEEFGRSKRPESALLETGANSAEIINVKLMILIGGNGGERASPIPEVATRKHEMLGPARLHSKPRTGVAAPHRIEEILNRLFLTARAFIIGVGAGQRNRHPRLERQTTRLEENSTPVSGVPATGISGWSRAHPLRRPGRIRCLYLATFDPTGSTSGTATRGRLFLRAFSRTFETHVLHIAEKHVDGTDHDLVARLASIQTIPYSRWRYFCFSFGLYRAAARMIQAGEVDFIFADFEKSGFYAFLLRRRFGIPYVYNSHNVEFLRYVDIGRSNPSRYLFVPYLCLAEWIACRQALFTISISHKDASTFARWLPPERLSVMPCAFDESSLHPHYVDLPEVHPVVLLVGNYRNAGNRRGALHIFREVLPLVLQRRPETIFRFVGKDLPKEIHHPNVEALDFVEDLFDQYRRATVVIAPIEIGGGIKIKVVEALAAGRFVVATEKAMEGIPAGDFENLRVTPLDSFADAIIEALGSNCGKTTRNYDRLCAQFGTQTQLSELTQRIERELTLPTDCVH